MPFAIQVSDDPAGAGIEDTCTDLVLPADRLDLLDGVQLVLEASELRVDGFVVRAAEIRAEGFWGRHFNECTP